MFPLVLHADSLLALQCVLLMVRQLDRLCAQILASMSGMMG